MPLSYADAETFKRHEAIRSQLKLVRDALSQLQFLAGRSDRDLREALLSIVEEVPGLIADRSIETLIAEEEAETDYAQNEMELARQERRYLSSAQATGR